MQSYSKKTLFIVVYCMFCSFSIILAQDTKTKVEPETKSEPEVKIEPVEVKVEPSFPPTTSNDSPPTYVPSKSNSSENNDTNGSTDTNSTSTSSKPRTTILNDVDRRRRRAKQKDEIERRQREARRRNRRKNRRKNNHDYYLNCPNYDPYSECENYDDTISGNSPVNPLLYFDKNDVAYFNYANYFETVSTKYVPYFNEPLNSDYKPLYTLGFVEASPDLPYITPFWVFYYEPDLDNFYIDFARLKPKGTAKFERLIIKPVGKKTTKKVGKVFKYKGKVRPAVVEDITSFSLNRIYTFNISYLPKGKYELMLLSRDGHTVKLNFNLK